MAQTDFERGVGIGYMLATGNVYSLIDDFHEFAESIVERPIYSHEFADKKLWDELRSEYEAMRKLRLQSLMPKRSNFESKERK